jgi:Ca-activated chloride channel family protein
LLLPAFAWASPSSALRDYEAGRFDESLKEYERSIGKQGTNADHRLHFNAGAAAYRDQQYDKAFQFFTNALEAQDLTLQEKAYYNLGNTLFQLGEQNPDPRQKMQSWQGALRQYTNAITLNTNDADAKSNYAFVKERLEELQQQQQQQDSNQEQASNQDQSPQDQQQQQDSQSKDDQKQGSQSQQQQESQDRQQQEPGKQQQQQQQVKQEEKKDQGQAEQQKAQKSAGQEKESGGQDQQPYLPGQMTRQEAERLLDSQKDEELTLPVSRKDQASAQRSSGKDW